MAPLSFTHFILRYPNFREKAVTLSYDDGQIYDRKMVEILDRYGLRCTFNLNSGYLDDGNHITSQELPDLYQGHEVAIHTLTHPFLENLSTAGVAYQVIADRKNLESILHQPITGMAYPFGLKDVPGLVDTLRACGIRYARTAVGSGSFELPADLLRWPPTCHQASPTLWERIDAFLRPEDPATPPRRIRLRLLNIFGHSYEYEHDWDRLETICRKLSGHREVWYATNGEIADYLTAARSLRFSTDGKYVYNPTATTIYGCAYADIYAQCADANVILSPGGTVTL